MAKYEIPDLDLVGRVLKRQIVQPLYAIWVQFSAEQLLRTSKFASLSILFRHEQAASKARSSLRS